MNDISLDAICDIFGILEPEPEAVKRLDRWGCRYTSQKAHVLDWFASQDTTGGGAYSRQVGNTSARACYNRLLNPGMLIWIASALGAEDEAVERATAEAVKAERINYRIRCSAFRAVIPFDDVLDLMHRPDRWRHDARMSGLYSMGADNMPHLAEGKDSEFERILLDELGI